MRILQDNLVFVNALPSDASSRDVAICLFRKGLEGERHDPTDRPHPRMGSLETRRQYPSSHAVRNQEPPLINSLQHTCFPSLQILQLTCNEIESVEALARVKMASIQKLKIGGSPLTQARTRWPTSAAYAKQTGLNSAGSTSVTVG